VIQNRVSFEVDFLVVGCVASSGGSVCLALAILLACQKELLSNPVLGLILVAMLVLPQGEY